MDGNVETNQTVYNLNGKIISIPVVDSTLLKEGHAADAKVTGEELEARVKKSDIVDNLTTEDARKPLSANQGKVLKKMLDDMTTSGAGSVGYDNTTSGLAANNMQSAIDELADKAKTQGNHIDDLAIQMDDFEENYLSKNGGGMITGAIHVRNADNGYSSLNKNNSATADYGTQVVDRTKDGKVAFLSISALLGTFNYTDPDGNIRNVHHEGTKPFVEYTGNGNATTRTISTKGFGRFAVLYCSTRLSFVTPKGAWVIDLTTGTGSWIDGSKLSFINGNLLTGTANEACNKADETYYLQVI